MTGPAISVVVPYYDDQDRLDVLLAALDRQTAVGSFEVVVADDGSPRAPRIAGDLGFACGLVRQPDQGFRAAAARNLGAAQASGDILLFLDQDTLPTARYVERMAQAVRTADDGHGVLVVGRRRHFHRGTATTDAVLDLLAGDVRPPGSAGPDLLPEPEWLARGYRRTANLRDAGDEDFRLVISAVLGVDRRLWTAVGGFDAGFVGYGGEDWEFAWRCWLAGATWRHVPDAVAWHDGADPGARGIPVAAKNAESMVLAAAIPLPSVRGSGLVHPLPAVAVRYLGAVTGDSRDAAAVGCVAGLLDGADAAVWFPRCGSAGDLPPLLRDDPRVRAGEVPAGVTARVPFTVDIERPLCLPTNLEQFCRRGDRVVHGWLRTSHTRSVTRGQRPDQQDAEHAGLRPIDPTVSLERWWGGW